MFSPYHRLVKYEWIIAMQGTITESLETIAKRYGNDSSLSINWTEWWDWIREAKLSEGQEL